MQRLTAAAAICGALSLAAPAYAQMTGGSVGLSRSFFISETDIAKTTLDGSLEFGLSPNFALQGDLSLNHLKAVDETLTNATMHAIFHAGEATAVGGFLGFDTIEGDSSTIYGAEARLKPSDPILVEGYIGRNENRGDRVTQLGASGSFAMNRQVSFGTRFDYGDFNDGGSATRFAISTDFNVTPNATLTAELGQLDSKAFAFGGNEAYLKLGGRINFGRNGGATFGMRSLANLIPGL